MRLTQEEFDRLKALGSGDLTAAITKVLNYLRCQHWIAALWILDFTQGPKLVTKYCKSFHITFFQDEWDLLTAWLKRKGKIRVKGKWLRVTMRHLLIEAMNTIEETPRFGNPLEFDDKELFSEPIVYLR